VPDLYRQPHDARQLVERHHVRPVGWRAGGIGVRLEEKAIGNRRRSGIQQPAE